MSEWKECKVGDIAKSNLLTLDKNYPHKEILYLDTGSITCGRIDSVQSLSLENAPSRAKRLVRESDIIYSTVRPIQRHYGFIKNPAENLVVSTGFSVITADKTKADPLFLYYLLTSDDSVEVFDVIAEASTSTYPSLKPSDIENFDISLPPLPEQKAIAEVLTSLDDKIDLLHKQNKTLEQLAETLFRHHFIDNAKDDWEEKNLLNLIKLVGGGTPKTSVPEFWDGDINWLSGGDIASNHKSFISSSEKMITQDGLDNSSAKLLPKFATIISARGTVGKFALLSKRMTCSQSNYGILPQVKDCFFFTYLLINHAVSELQSSAYGSVFDTITTNTFKEVSISVPKDECIEEFERNISSYFLKKLACVEQIQVLQKTRDQLLPKLMSGEININKI